jgi:hypothetical protein
MKIYKNERSVSFFKSENLVRIKGVFNERKFKKVLNFNYFSFIIGFDKEMHIHIKL